MYSTTEPGETIVKTETTSTSMMMTDGDISNNIVFDNNNDDDNDNDDNNVFRAASTTTTTAAIVIKAEPTSSTTTTTTTNNSTKIESSIEERTARHEVTWRSKTHASLLYADALEEQLDRLESLADLDQSLLNSVIILFLSIYLVI